jgi:hypothetical protein
MQQSVWQHLARGPQMGFEEVGRIGTVKSASVYRWRDVAIAIAASA